MMQMGRQAIAAKPADWRKQTQPEKDPETRQKKGPIVTDRAWKVLGEDA